MDMSDDSHTLSERVAKMAAIPFSVTCADCLIGAEFCKSRIPKSTTERDTMEEECYTELMECSGSSASFELPLYWEKLINGRLADGEFIARNRERYNRIDSNGQTAFIRSIISGTRNVLRPTKDQLEHLDNFVCC